MDAHISVPSARQGDKEKTKVPCALGLQNAVQILVKLHCGVANIICNTLMLLQEPVHA